MILVPRYLCVLLLLCVLLCYAGCGGPSPIVVASKNFTEQLILGELAAQQLERCGLGPVQRKLNLGGTLLAHQAITSGQIDLYPEYTGTALTAVLQQQPEADPNAVFQRVQRAYQEQFQVEWLPPLGFENTFAMAVRAEKARELGVRTLSEAAGAGPWRLGVGYEFEQRPDGLPGLLKTYPLRLEGPVKSMDLGLLYQALQQDQVDMVAGNSTDGLLEALNLVVLEDNHRYFPPYQAAYLVRQETLQRHPGMRGCLEQLSGSLSAQRMRQLNREADRGGKSIEEIVRAFLAELPAAK